MSDNWITVVPRDPFYIPSASQRERAERCFAEIVGTADEIVTKQTDSVQFYDCGVNLERVNCPACKQDIPLEWWQDRLEDDRSEVAGFSLRKYVTPCCGLSERLSDLVYDWPQAFGRFALDAMNPASGRLPVAALRELADTLGTEIVVVYQHI